MNVWINRIQVWLTTTLGVFGAIVFLIGVVLLVPGGIVVAIAMIINWVHDQLTMTDHYDE